MDVIDQVKIAFDDENQIRVLAPEKSKHSAALSSESEAFVTKTRDFHELTQRILTVLDTMAQTIERQKLLAIGTRNSCDSEEENRRRQILALQVQIKERRTELDRYAEQYQSLQRLEAEQMTLLDTLSNSDAK
mmetsp:Transcript_5095/g.20348  ORF Transcript_5095/g.20348 Transcript_5095/m.20348 type:complete len:133 (-) Transcript_5095:1697-2095(-)